MQIAYRNQIATIVVEDSGIGIPREDLTRIFEPFDRGARADGLAAPGLGLGLTITKLLAELMGGDIAVTSEIGKGYALPGAADALGGRQSDPPATPPRIRGYEGRRRTIVVVDDDQDHRDLMREALEPLGSSSSPRATAPSA